LYIGYFNDTAYELIEWSFMERKNNNKIKAVKIERIADKMELKHRKQNQIPLEDIWCYQPYVNGWRYAHVTRFAYDKVFL
jgi:hypothetical protein